MSRALPAVIGWAAVFSAALVSASLGATGSLPSPEGSASVAATPLPALSGSAAASAIVPPEGFSDGPPSEVLVPPQELPLHFSHAKHASRGIACVACHTSARTSRTAADRILPPPRVCDRCHGSDHALLAQVHSGPSPTGACEACHDGYLPSDGNRVRRVVIPQPFLRFSHQAHAVRNIGCGQCHGAVQREELATRADLPRMRGCLRCHDLPDDSRGDADSACATCHLLATTGALRTAFPTGTLLPPSWLRGAHHGPDFARHHGAVAANDSRFCASCHTEDQCLRCHDGTLRPRDIHPNDYLSMHSVEARQDAGRCSSCHRAESFCKTCHLRSGVTETGPSWNRRAQGRFHPEPEVFTTGPRSSRHHATEARRNISSCVGCHTERDCVACHASRGNFGAGINPHPGGFSGRCSAALARNPRPCLVCHEADSALLERCR